MKKRNRKRKLTRSQKGISLIALTTTILVLAIVTSIVVYNSKNNIMIKQYKKIKAGKWWYVSDIRAAIRR